MATPFELATVDAALLPIRRPQDAEQQKASARCGRGWNTATAADQCPARYQLMYMKDSVWYLQ